MPVLSEDDHLRRLLIGARTIAVVGLSPDPSRDSHMVAAFLRQAGYRVLPVNPTVASVLGEQSWPAVDGIPEPVDIVDIFRRPEHVPDIVEAALRSGARAIWMQPGTSHAGATRRASAAGLAVVVDRCILVEHRRLMRSAGIAG
jgi:predicted CoA-binding protein